MNIVLGILIVFFCVVLVYQDFRERRISVWLLMGIFLLLFFNPILSGTASFHFRDMLLNISYVILLLILLSIYFSVKEKRLVNIFDSYIGVGDFLFLFAITPAFSLPVFVFFTTAGLFVSLLVYLLFFVLMKKQSHREIPLAGCLAGAFSIVILFQTFFVESESVFLKYLSILPSISYPTSNVSYLKSHISSLISHISYLKSHISYLTSHI